MIDRYHLVHRFVAVLEVPRRLSSVTDIENHYCFPETYIVQLSNALQRVGRGRWLVKSLLRCHSERLQLQVSDCASPKWGARTPIGTQGCDSGVVIF